MKIGEKYLVETSLFKQVEEVTYCGKCPSCGREWHIHKIIKHEIKCYIGTIMRTRSCNTISDFGKHCEECKRFTREKINEGVN